MQYYPQGYSGAASAVSAVMSGDSSAISHANGLPPLQLGDTGAGGANTTSQHASTKRKQVKNACTNCQKACKKCDDARPCPRCVKYGITDTCVNSVRKERKKGIKRGPYKRRQKHDDDERSPKRDGHDQQQAQFGSALNTMHYGYPTNLNQYGQPYGVFPMGYPVLGAGQTPQQYHNITQHHSPQPSSSPMTSEQQHASLHDQTSGPPLQAVKDEDNGKPQPLTPVPSTSSSSVTSSPPESTEDDEGSKFARLTQLCSAALHHQHTETKGTQNPS